MNKKMVINVPLKILFCEAVLMLLPGFISLGYREKSAYAFFITAGAAIAVCAVLIKITKPKNSVIFAKEGFVIVALAWIGMSLLGCVPFVASGAIPSFADALFETASGFTTTGSSVVTNVEELSHGILFWRSFTHWVGGMGILVFCMSLTGMSDRPIHIMRAEMPGPIVGKIVPKAKQTAKILYVIYIVLTVIEIVLLTAGDMTLFESVVHSLGTAGTGGFGIKYDGLAGYSPYSQWVIAVFMALFGVNFNLYFMIVIRRIKDAFKSTELWLYIGILAVSSAIISCNIYNLYGNVGETVRTAFFQVSSIATTTGFSTADFDMWPGLSKGILFTLMFIGGCAGSTAGGFKISRVMIVFKALKRELEKMLHPRRVKALRLEGKALDEDTITGSLVYLAVYCICLAVTFLLLCTDKMNFETNISAAVACFNNIGPGFSAVGPSLSYADYSVFSKIVLTAAMLLGRLEIFPLVLAFSPSMWKK